MRVNLCSLRARFAIAPHRSTSRKSQARKPEAPVTARAAPAGCGRMLRHASVADAQPTPPRSPFLACRNGPRGAAFAVAAQPAAAHLGAIVGAAAQSSGWDRVARLVQRQRALRRCSAAHHGRLRQCVIVLALRRLSAPGRASFTTLCYRAEANARLEHWRADQCPRKECGRSDVLCAVHDELCW